MTRVEACMPEEKGVMMLCLQCGSERVLEGLTTARKHACRTLKNRVILQPQNSPGEEGCRKRCEEEEKESRQPTFPKRMFYSHDLYR